LASLLLAAIPNIPTYIAPPRPSRQRSNKPVVGVPAYGTVVCRVPSRMPGRLAAAASGKPMCKGRQACAESFCTAHRSVHVQQARCVRCKSRCQPRHGARGLPLTLERLDHLPSPHSLHTPIVRGAGLSVWYPRSSFVCISRHCKEGRPCVAHRWHARFYPYYSRYTISQPQPANTYPGWADTAKTVFVLEHLTTCSGCTCYRSPRVAKLPSSWPSRCTGH
jgi:hypothetical protein